MVEKVDKGMATKRGAQALEIGRRRKAFKKAKAASAKAAKHYGATKASHARKPDSSGDARVKKAQKEMRASIKKMSDAFKLSRKVPFKQGGKVKAADRGKSKAKAAANPLLYAQKKRREKTTQKGRDEAALGIGSMGSKNRSVRDKTWSDLKKKMGLKKGGKVGLQTKNRAGMGKTIKSKTTKRKKG